MREINLRPEFFLFLIGADKEKLGSVLFLRRFGDKWSEEEEIFG